MPFFPRTIVLHLSFESEVWTVRRLAEDALVLKPRAVALARSRSLARTLARHNQRSVSSSVGAQPLYSSKYRNDSSLPWRESARPCNGLNAQRLTTSNYVIAEELLTEPVPRPVIQ